MTTLQQAGAMIVIAARGVPPEEDPSDALLTIMRRVLRSQDAAIEGGAENTRTFQIIGQLGGGITLTLWGNGRT